MTDTLTSLEAWYTMADVRKRRGSPEKRLQGQIVRALRSMGFFVTSTSQPQRAMCTPGIPDLFVVHDRWKLAVWIEVKTPKGRVSTTQKVWHREVGRMMPVLVVRSVDELVEDLKALGAPIA